MSLTVFLNTEKFVEEYAETVIELAAMSVENAAVKNVRVDTGNLKNSIKRQPINKNNWIVKSEAPYSLAQEYGLRANGKPNYGFTSYMRPAVQETEGNFGTIKNDAEKMAKRKATVNKKI